MWLSLEWLGAAACCSMLRYLMCWGGEKVIGVDIFIPDDLRQRLMSHGRLSQHICLVSGSSIEQATLRHVQSLLGDSRETMVFLDSFHTHEHVLQELRLYSPLVGKGHYLICGDTLLENIPVQEHRPQPWGPGNNPKTALDQFLEENDRFEVDKGFEDKLLFSCNPGGYLRCCKD